MTILGRVPQGTSGKVKPQKTLVNAKVSMSTLRVVTSAPCAVTLMEPVATGIHVLTKGGILPERSGSTKGWLNLRIRPNR